MKQDVRIGPGGIRCTTPDVVTFTPWARIAKLSAYHSLYYSQGRIGHKAAVGSSYGFHTDDPPLRPLVKIHPVTGRKSLFIGRHAYLPREGVAVHINAFNFPIWGMLEKFAPAILAGMPVITKPATTGAYLAEAAARLIIDSNILPPGALQLICGATHDLFDHLNGQDMIGFTGSMETSARLQSHPGLLKNAVPFVAERDSLRPLRAMNPTEVPLLPKLRG